MKLSAVSRVALHVGVVGLLVCLCVTRAEPQDPNLKPAFGKVDLKAGFPNDPYEVKVVAGGSRRSSAASRPGSPRPRTSGSTTRRASSR